MYYAFITEDYARSCVPRYTEEDIVINSNIKYISDKEQDVVDFCQKWNKKQRAIGWTKEGLHFVKTILKLMAYSWVITVFVSVALQNGWLPGGKVNISYEMFWNGATSVTFLLAALRIIRLLIVRLLWRSIFNDSIYKD